MGQSRGILRVSVTLATVAPSQLLPFCTGLGAERSWKGPGRGWSPCGHSYWLCCTCTSILLGGKMIGAVPSLPGPGMVEVGKECGMVGSAQLWLQAHHSHSHLLPQNRDSCRGKSHFLLPQLENACCDRDSPQNGLFCSLAAAAVVVLALMTQLCFLGFSRQYCGVLAQML